MKVFVLEAEHPRISGRILKLFADKASADAEAASCVNIMLADTGRAADATEADYEHKLGPLQDEHGAAHCYAEVSEKDMARIVAINAQAVAHIPRGSGDAEWRIVDADSDNGDVLAVIDPHMTMDEPAAFAERVAAMLRQQPAKTEREVALENALISLCVTLYKHNAGDEQSLDLAADQCRDRFGLRDAIVHERAGFWPGNKATFTASGSLDRVGKWNGQTVEVVGVPPAGEVDDECVMLNVQAADGETFHVFADELEAA